MIQTAATHIEIRPNRDGQPRAFIAGTRVRVQDIFAQAEIHGRTPEEVVEGLPHLSLGQVHAAQSYLHDHRDDILREMREDEAFVNELRTASGPSLLERHRAKGAGTVVGVALAERNEPRTEDRSNAARRSRNQCRSEREPRMARSSRMGRFF